MEVLTGCRAADVLRIKTTLQIFFIAGCLGGLIMRVHGCIGPDCVRSTCKETDGPFICWCPENFVLEPGKQTCIRKVTSVITTVSTTIQTKSTSLLSESTNPVSSTYSTSIPLKSEARDVLLSSSSRSIPLEAAATDGNGPSASTSLPILPATLRSLSLELIGESTIIPQLVDTDVPAHSTSTATSLPSKNADVAHPFPPRVLNLELQHEVAIIPFTSTPLPLKTVLSNEIFKKEILPSLHGANKILTSKSNAKNIGFHAVIQATNFKNDDRHLVHRELLPTVSSSTTQAWIPTHRVGTTFKTLLVISTSHPSLPSTTVTYKAQTNVPVTSVATRTGLVTTDVTTPSTMPVTSSSHSDVTTTSVLNKVFPKLNVLDDEISKVDVSHRKVPKINALRTQIPILNKTVPKINVLRKEIPQIRIASREIPKINILQTEIPIIRKPIPKINILQTEIPIIRKPIPKINILQTEIPIIRKPIPKHKTSARPRLSDHRVESSVQNRASKTQALRVSKSVNFLLGLVAMLQHHRRVKNDKHRLAKLSVEKVAPSPARYQSSQCQYTGCVNGVCQQVAAGTFKCRCNVGFQPSTNINMCVPRRYHFDSCSTDKTCMNGRCVRHGQLSVCQCNHGYRYNTWSCVDINECVVESACRRGVCFNYQGGYSCSCYPGYYLQAHRNGRQCTRKRIPSIGSVGWLWLLMMGEGM